MDIKMLDYVVMIAKCESISKAAEKLYLTQSGLNQQLLKLERNLGIKLFERDHHHFLSYSVYSLILFANIHLARCNCEVDECSLMWSSSAISL